MDVQNKGKGRIVDESQVFGLSNWKSRVETNQAGKGGGNRFEGERDQEFHSRRVGLRYLFDMDRETWDR